jgi:2-polyprenyl-3-methyl-5-hydroxy-6-metoxy-1,4-benzoquinol methylase
MEMKSPRPTTHLGTSSVQLAGPGASSAVAAPSAVHSAEVRKGERFEFGANWSRFLEHLDDSRITEAERSLQSFLGVPDLTGKTFLDVGSGSGLFSLAARRLGATVRSFDYDPASVACTRELKRRYFAEDTAWQVSSGSVLDTAFLATLGQFDVVYSWGVLHHTGQMWQALENVAPLVRTGGQLFIAIYNEQGGASRRWAAVKRLYNRAPRPLKPIVVMGVAGWAEGRSGLIRLLRGKNPIPLSEWRSAGRERGMSPWHDWVDWVGGYPFEVATPDQIFEFYRRRGFTMTRLSTVVGGFGCNQFVFRHLPAE